MEFFPPILYKALPFWCILMYSALSRYFAYTPVLKREGPFSENRFKGT